jgi:hypothetical protein
MELETLLCCLVLPRYNIIGKSGYYSISFDYRYRIGTYVADNTVKIFINIFLPHNFFFFWLVYACFMSASQVFDSDPG